MPSYKKAFFVSIIFLALTIILIPTAYFCGNNQKAEEVLPDKSQNDKIIGLTVEVIKKNQTIFLLRDKLEKILADDGAAFMAFVVLTENLLKKQRQPDLSACVKLGKKELQTGECVLFNASDAIYAQEYLDNKNFIKPRVAKECLELGIFIHSNEANAYVYSPSRRLLFRCNARVIPEQNIVLFNKQNSP